MNLFIKFFDLEIQKYLIWTEKQRNFHKEFRALVDDRSCRKNNLNSDFYLFICQIYSLLELITRRKKKGKKEILIICDDIYLIDTVKIFLKEKKYDVRARPILLSLKVY